MKDILLRHRDEYIKCDINGLELTYTYSDEPKRHYVLTLRDRGSYPKFKAAVNEIYNDYADHDLAYAVVNDFLQSSERYEFFTRDTCYIRCDPRDEDEIVKYCREAEDKVWLMRTRPCDEYPDIEADRQIAVKRILNTYNDIPREGYTDWECGYWNGIMGALRWVLGDDKDFLDT